jgi:hypothetical protein
MVRAFLVAGLLITVCAAASAAAMHGFQPHEGRLRLIERVTAPPTIRARLDIIRKWFDQDGVDAMQNFGSSSIALGQGTLSRRRKRSLITTVGSAKLMGKMARQPRNRLLHETIYRSPFVQDRRTVPRAH